MTAIDLTKLADRMATTSTGYGAVIDGILNIRTVTETANMAAYNALFLVGYRVLTTCFDSDCDCKLQLLNKVRPDIRIVPVRVEADDAPKG
jgi:hypothetical protein